MVPVTMETKILSLARQLSTKTDKRSRFLRSSTLNVLSKLMMKICAWSPGKSLSDQTIIIAQIGLYIMEPPEGKGYSKLKNLFAREGPSKMVPVIMETKNLILALLGS